MRGRTRERAEPDHVPAGPRRRRPATGEQQGADEVKQRLDESRERLKREIPEPQD